MPAFLLPALSALGGGGGGVASIFTGVTNLGSWIGGLVGGSGPDIDQRVKDYNNYLAIGKVLGGDPKNDSTWVFNFDYMRKNPTDPWAGVLKDSRFVNNWNAYLKEVGYYDNGKQAVPITNQGQAINNVGKPTEKERAEETIGLPMWVYWALGVPVIALIIWGAVKLFSKRKR